MLEIGQTQSNILMFGVTQCRMAQLGRPLLLLRPSIQSPPPHTHQIKYRKAIDDSTCVLRVGAVNQQLVNRYGTLIATAH
jgi:hypothetical protein